MKRLRPLKIKCENWWQNRRLQLLLIEKYGVNWPAPVKVPFNCRRRGVYLFLTQNPINKTWWFGWGTKGDFDYSPLDPINASTLYAELSS